MKTRLRGGLLVLLAAVLPAAAVILPLTFPFQGKLIDPVTNNPKNGSFSMQFKLYGGPTGGAALFSETQTVSVQNGVFNVQIGTVSLLSAELFWGASAYLGVTVGADAEMSPRQPISMNPYAFTAMQLVSDGNIRINSGVAYSTYTTAGNWQFPYGVIAASADVTDNDFSVGISSFVVDGGSATVGYRMSAGSFLTTASMTASGYFGNGSALTGLPTFQSGGGTMTGQLTNTSSITIRGSGPDQYSLQTSSGIYVASGTVLANGGGGIVAYYNLAASTGTFMTVTLTTTSNYGVLSSSGISMTRGTLDIDQASRGIDATGTGISATTATFMTVASTNVGTFSITSSSGISMLAGTFDLDPSASIDATGTGIRVGSATVLDNDFSVGGSSFVVDGGSATVGYRMSAGSLLTTASMTASGFFGNGTVLTNLPIVLTSGGTMTGPLTTTSSITIRGSGANQYSLQTSSGIYIASGTLLANGGGGLFAYNGIVASTGTFMTVAVTTTSNYGVDASSGISMTRGTLKLATASRGVDATGTGVSATTATFMTVVSTNVGDFGVTSSSGITMTVGSLSLNGAATLDATGTGVAATTATFMTLASTNVGTFSITSSSGISMLNGTFDLDPSVNIDATGTGIAATTATFMTLTSTNVGTFSITSSSGINMLDGTLTLAAASRGVNATGTGIVAETGVFASSMTAQQFFGIGVSTLAVRTANQNIISNTTLTNDDTLVLPLAANQTYSVYGVLFASSVVSTNDIKIAFTVPAGATMDIGYRANGGSTTTFTSGILRDSGVANEPIIQVAGGSVNPIFISGTVVNGGTAGFLRLQWAQFASIGTNMALSTGSYIGARRIQ